MCNTCYWYRDKNRKAEVTTLWRYTNLFIIIIIIIINKSVKFIHFLFTS